MSEPVDLGEIFEENNNGLPAEYDYDVDPMDDYESIDDIARSNGFYIDEDNHWIPLDDDEW